ncbi:MAG: WYL domain-containing protein [Longimicrobiales bacterium]
MTDGTTAADRLTRLLHVLPAAARPEGAALDELAEALGTTRERIVEDVRDVTDRAFYHPGGWPDDVVILVDAERVRVQHAVGFDRPVQLNTAETLALALALRCTSAASHLQDPDTREGLLARAEAHLSSARPEDMDAVPTAAPDHAPDPADIRQEVLRAARHRRRCAMVYLKSGDDDLSVRMVDPYAVAYARGAWYTVGHCHRSDGVRIFRMDRIVEAAAAPDATFEVPDSFDLGTYITDGGLYHAPHESRARVRYAPTVARWVRERAEVHGDGWTEEPDGAVVVEHRVADPSWVVSHALQYGPAAEILEPPELRGLAREVVEEMAEGLG